MIRRTVVGATIALGMTLAACGSSSSPDSAATPAAGTFNEADVLFAQSMIPHHEQAIEMADIALDPTVGAGPQIKDLATRIKAGQDPEIQQLTGLLNGWGEPIAMDTSDGHDMSEMAGMMSADDMHRLGGMTAAEFDKTWAAMMIEHHEGAIEMAEAVKADGSNPEILALADNVVAAQEAEIEEMTSLAG